MKVKASLMKRAISVAKSALPIRAAEPKFDAIWFSCAGNCVRVAGFNPDGTYHEATVACESPDATFEFALASGLASDAVGSMPQDEEIEVFLEKNKCVLKNSLGKMQIPVLNIEMQQFKDHSLDLFFECNRQALIKAVQACKFSESHIKGTAVEKTSLSVRGGNVFMFCRSSSSGALAEICQFTGEDHDRKVFLELARLRKAIAACDGEAVSFSADEKRVRIESDSDGVSVCAEFMQEPSHPIAIDPMAAMQVGADATISDVALARSAFAQASVLKLPEHCSVELGFVAGGIFVSTETVNGNSLFSIPAVSEADRKTLARVEDMERGIGILSGSGCSVRLVVLCHNGEDKVVMLENETKTIRLFSATMERK